MEKVSIEKSIAWNSMGSMVYLITQWLISVLVVRISGVETAGILTLAMSVNNVFYSIAMQGIRNYQVSDIKEKYTSGNYVSSRIIICACSFCICIGYSMTMRYQAMENMCIIAYCLFKMSEALYDVYAGICQKKWRMDYIGKSWMIRGILTFFGFIITMVITKNLFLGIIVMAVISYLVMFGYDIPKAQKLDSIQIKIVEKKNIVLMTECFPLLCYQTLASIIPTIPRLVIEKMLGSAALGIYGSVSAPTMIVQMGASYVFNPFITLFAEQYANGDIKGFWKTFRKCILAIFAISVVALCGGKIFGHWGLQLLYGAEVAEYEYLLLPLIGCTILTAVVWFLCALLTVVREIKGLVICNTVVLPISYWSAIMLTKRYGMQGGSCSLMISYMVEIVLLAGLLIRKIRKQET